MKSHESRQASAPKIKTCSSRGGNRRKFRRRSNLTLEDSYGKSLLAGRCMYKGEGRSEDSSSWRYVGRERGGIGIIGSVGEG